MSKDKWSKAPRLKEEQLIKKIKEGGPKRGDVRLLKKLGLKPEDVMPSRIETKGPPRFGASTNTPEGLEITPETADAIDRELNPPTPNKILDKQGSEVKDKEKKKDFNLGESLAKATGKVAELADSSYFPDLRTGFLSKASEALTPRTNKKEKPKEYGPLTQEDEAWTKFFKGKDIDTLVPKDWSKRKDDTGESTIGEKKPVEETDVKEIKETEPVEPKITKPKETKPKKEEMGSIRKAQAKFEKTLKAIGTPPDDPLMESEEGAVLSNTLKESNLALSELSDPPMTGPEQRALAYKELKKARQSRVNTLEWAKVFEKLVAAVTKYGAAREGLNRGLDMSRAEIERTDWDAMINQAFDTYKLDLDEISTRFDKEDKAKEKVDSKRVALDKQAKTLEERIARIKDQTARDKRRDSLRKKELAQRKDIADRRLEQTKALAEAKTENRVDKPLSTFDKQKMNAEARIRYMIDNGESRNDIKKEMTELKKYLDDAFLSTIEEQPKGFGPDFSRTQQPTPPTPTNIISREDVIAQYGKDTPEIRAKLKVLGFTVRD